APEVGIRHNKMNVGNKIQINVIVSEINKAKIGAEEIIIQE
ncbi:17685_t:CDS:1, partial [Dentiscutata erythropus]